MATKVISLSKLCTKSLFTSNATMNGVIQRHAVRRVASNCETIPGVIPPEPLKKKFSIPVVISCIATGVYVGQYLAKTFAAFMEETELFVPDDDDD